MLGIDGKYSTTEREDDGLLYLFLVTGLTCFSLPILSLFLHCYCIDHACRVQFTCCCCCLSSALEAKVIFGS